MSSAAVPLVRLPARVLVCSTVIPPDISGQAVVLGRLFESIDPLDYCLVSFGPPSVEGSDAGRPLPATAHRIDARWRYGKRHTNRFVDLLLAHRDFLAEAVRRGRRLVELVESERCRALIVTSGGIPDLAAGWLAARKTGSPLIVYMFDEWRHQIAVSARLGALASVAQRLVLSAASVVFVPNDSLKVKLERAYGCRCVTVPNPRGTTAPPPAHIGQSQSDELAIVYTGKVYVAQADSIARLLNALESPRLPPSRLHIYSDQSARQVLVGGIRGKVTVHPAQSPSQIQSVQSEADILYLPLAFESPYPQIIKTSIPSKLPDYLASERPILVHAPSWSFLAGYASSESFAEVVDEPAPELLVDAILRLISEPKTRAAYVSRAATLAARDYSPAVTTERFAATLRSALVELR